MTEIRPIGPTRETARVLAALVSRKRGTRCSESRLMAELVAVIWGSNMIESAGTSYDSARRICHSLFDDKLPDVCIPETHWQYEDHLAQLVDHQRPATADEMTASRQEVVSHFNALMYMLCEVVLENKPVSEAMICETHRLLAEGGLGHDDDDDDDTIIPGAYRDHEVAVRYANGKTRPCMRASAVPGRMAQLCRELAADFEDESNVYGRRFAHLAIARAHQLFAYIHPFADGNGRVVRILVNVLMLNCMGRVCILGESKPRIRSYLEVVGRGCAAFHGEDFEVPRERQKSHVPLSKYLVERSLAMHSSWLDTQ